MRSNNVKKNGNSKKIEKSYWVIVLLFFTIFLFIPLVIGIKIKFDEIKGNTKSINESSQISRSVDTDNKETDINLLDKNELENLTNHAKYSRDQNGLYELTGPVIDVANLLSQPLYEELDNFLRDLDSSTGAQIAVFYVIISFALLILFVCIADKFIGTKNGGRGSSYSSRRSYSSSSSRSSSTRSYSSGRSYSGGGGHFGGGGASGRW